MKKSIVLMMAIVASSAQLTIQAVDTKKEIIVINTSAFEDITISFGIGNTKKVTIVANNNARNNPDSAAAISLSVGSSMQITATKGGKTVAKDTYKRADLLDTVFTVTVKGPDNDRFIFVEAITPKSGDTWQLFKKAAYAYLSDYLPQSSTAKPLGTSNK